MMHKTFAICASALFLVASSAANAGSDGHAAHWGYGHNGGPEEWGQLKADYATCGVGTQQSPIDIRTTDTIAADVGAIQFNYKAAPLRIVNNGHTIQANYAPGSFITVKGKKYELLQFHFHTPSEHTVNGQASEMELHLVHKSQAGDLAVIGVMMDAGKDNADIAALWANLPDEINKERMVSGITVNAAALLPKETGNYFHYEGSLTTPPCSEIVNWFVLKDPIEVSSKQVAIFSDTVGENARPVQAVNRRFVLIND